MSKARAQKVTFLVPTECFAAVDIVKINATSEHNVIITQMIRFPTSQSELIRSARGERTQAEFAKLVGCDRSCLSRYEHETLGAPTSLINYCLQSVAAAGVKGDGVVGPIENALTHVRQAVAALERLREPKDQLTDRRLK